MLDYWLPILMNAFLDVYQLRPLKASMCTFYSLKGVQVWNNMLRISIKWRFIFWYCCVSKTRFLYEFELHLRKKTCRAESRKKYCSSSNWMPWKHVMHNFFRVFLQEPCTYCKNFWQGCLCSWDSSKKQGKKARYVC